MQIIPYDFSGKTIRTMTDDKETIWFIVVDVCRYLALTNPRAAISHLKDNEKADVILNDGRQNRTYNIINEPGLYRLLLRTNSKKAEKFQHWVLYNLIPTVRKTGSYSINKPDLPTTKLGWMKLAVEAEEAKEKALIRAGTAEKENKKLLPKADALDQIAGGNGFVSFTQAAKNLGMKPRYLINLLLLHKVIYRTKDNKILLPMQYYLNHDWFKVKMTGPENKWPQTVIIQFGLTKLGTRFSRFYEKEK